MIVGASVRLPWLPPTPLASPPVLPAAAPFRRGGVVGAGGAGADAAIVGGAEGAVVAGGFVGVVVGVRAAALLL